MGSSAEEGGMTLDRSSKGKQTYVGHLTPAKYSADCSESSVEEVSLSDDVSPAPYEDMNPSTAPQVHLQVQEEKGPQQQHL